MEWNWGKSMHRSSTFSISRFRSNFIFRLNGFLMCFYILFSPLLLVFLFHWTYMRHKWWIHTFLLHNDKIITIVCALLLRKDSLKGFKLWVFLLVAQRESPLPVQLQQHKYYSLAWPSLLCDKVRWINSNECPVSPAVVAANSLPPVIASPPIDFLISHNNKEQTGLSRIKMEKYENCRH